MAVNIALHFINYCAFEPDIQIVFASFSEAIASYGFSACAAGAWVGTGGARFHRFYFNTWPADWVELYQSRGFFNFDPFVIESRRRMTPFLMSEMANEPSFTVEGRAAYDAAVNYGWLEVMGIPIHGPSGYQGLISLASKSALSLSVLDRAMLRAMSNALHDRAHGTLEIGLAAKPAIRLTPREIDCMRWVAAGKTDAEIGVILGISAATAHFHIERVKTKAQTRSRTEAAALLVLAGTI